MNKTPPIPKVTEEYLRTGATQGNRNQALMNAACQMRDAQWSPAMITDVLSLRGRQDGLTDSEITATIRSVLGRPARQPIGPMRSNVEQYGPKKHQKMDYTINMQPEEREPVIYALDEADELPEPMENGALELLQSLYSINDKIELVPGRRTEDGKEAPTQKGVILPVEQFVEKIKQKGGIGELFSAADENGKINHGLYFSINPLINNIDGRKKNNIQQYKYALLEFDTISLKQQWQLLKKSKVPCASISYSGNKSLHALVRVNARDADQYLERVNFLFDHFSEYDVDTQNKDPSRLSRMPGVVRGDTEKEQTLLSLSAGARDWDSWVSSMQNNFPDIMTQEDFYNQDLQEPPKIIEGLLHRQLSLVIGGSSKTYKSWTLLDMAMSVANGTDFWGMKTEKGKVLYINFEISDYYMRKRLEMISDAKGIDLPSENFYIWNLRGQAQALENIRPTFTKIMANANFSMVILDPIYKTLGNRDENAAGDINSLMNEMEHLALETGAAVVFATHFSKGNQAAKSPIDRISGSGVFARSPDTILVMTEHEDDGCYTVDSTVRNFDTPRPFVVKMNFPLFERVEADPAKLKRAGGRPQAEDSIPDVMACFSPKGDEWLSQKDVVKSVEEMGHSPSTIKRQIAKAIKEGKIERQASPGRATKIRPLNKEGIIYVQD